MQKVADTKLRYIARPAADFLLSIMYQTGYLVPRNIDKSWQYCKRAATRGYSVAQLTLKEIIEKAGPDNPFFHESLDWFVRAEQCVVPEAWHYAAVLLSSRSEQAASFEQITSLYTRAANSGYLPAQNNLALHLASRGLYEQAYEKLKLASDAGYTMAHFNMILMQMDGIAPVRNIAECITELNRMAACQFAPAQQRLAEIYRDGALVPKNDVTAFRLFSLAAEQGLLFSQFALVQMLLDENCIFYSPKKAFSQCKTLAEASYPPAQFLLGRLFNFGKGTAVCIDNATFWYHLAASNGEPNAVEWLEKSNQLSKN